MWKATVAHGFRLHARAARDAEGGAAGASRGEPHGPGGSARALSPPRGEPRTLEGASSSRRLTGRGVRWGWDTGARGGKAAASWGMSERERVYNTLLYVPLQVERLLSFGSAVCLTSFLDLFTQMPARIARAALGALAPARWRRPLSADALCDVCWALLIAVVWLSLSFISTSEIYHYIHGQVQEVIKLYGLLTILDVFDKIFLNLNVDCLEALGGSCAAVAGGTCSRGGRSFAEGPSPAAAARRSDWLRLGADFFVCAGVMLLHSFVLLCEAIAFSVAVTSESGNLMAILLSNNFNEIKSSVFKNMSVDKVWRMSILDIVERFHIVCALGFVLVHSMLVKGTMVPSPALAWQCASIVLIENVVDVLKHAFAGKLNDVKPGLYSEYLNDLCTKAADSRNENMHRVVNFVPLVPAVLLVRVAVPFARKIWKKACGLGMWKEALLGFALLYAALLLFQLALGWGLRKCAGLYRDYFEDPERPAVKRPWIVRTRAPPHQKVE